MENIKILIFDFKSLNSNQNQIQTFTMNKGCIAFIQYKIFIHPKTV